MTLNLSNIMGQKTEDELINILTLDRDDYTENAIETAKIEFEKRGFNLEKYEKSYLKYLELKKNLNENANKPLEKQTKIIGMILPYISIYMYKKEFQKNGFERKIRELYTASNIGIILYILLNILTLFIIYKFQK